MREVEVRVHLDHLPAPVAVLVDSDEEAGVVLFAPLDVKVGRLRMARNHVPYRRTHILSGLSILDTYMKDTRGWWARLVT